jgi:hypothetical protein
MYLKALLWICRPPLWYCGQSSCLQIQKSGFDFRRYQISWGVVDLERGPLSLVSTNEELLGRKSSGFGLESREYGRRDPSRWPHGALYPQKLALTSPPSGSRSMVKLRSRTQAREFFYLKALLWTWWNLASGLRVNCNNNNAAWGMSNGPLWWRHRCGEQVQSSINVRNFKTTKTLGSKFLGFCSTWIETDWNP